ncbi:MAG: DNA-3-methyladenine glycosylase 2 [Zoogloea sp.]|nr:DNA-3-methyladenine glycosylase 2 [Zoogloea sp.]
MAALACSVPLPPDFRPDDVRAFHARDTQQLAERVGPDRIAKGLVWNGHPASLEIVFRPGHADACLAIDGPCDGVATTLEDLVRHLLGLTQPVESFETAHRAHALLGPLIARHPGLRVPQAATPFEALTWAVTGQQISVHAALALRRRLIGVAGITHSDGLACYPDAFALVRLNAPQLHTAGFSHSKAQTLLDLARLVIDGHLPLDAWRDGTPADEIRNHLLAVRGIGPWTVNYTLLRGFAHLDGSLHGDAAVRRKLQSLLGQTERLTADEAETWLTPFSPWRALVAAHLWAAPWVGLQSDSAG